MTRARTRLPPLLLALSLAGTGAAAPTSGALPPGTWRMKRVEVIDQRGFERPMPALSMLVPVDWKLEGEVRYATKPGCVPDLVRVAFRASSPDGQVAVEGLPDAFWNWAAAPSLRQAMEARARQAAAMGATSCALRQPMNARDYLLKVLIPRVRPGSQVSSVEPVPGVAAILRKQEATLQQAYRSAGVPTTLQADHARARIAYDRGGQPVDEWLTTVVWTAATDLPAFDPARGGLVPSRSYQCASELTFATSAPRGRLSEYEKLFAAVLSTVRKDPRWAARVQQVQTNMSAAERKGAMDRARIQAQTASEIHDMIARGYAERQASQDRAADASSHAIRNTETFENPTTGERVDLSNLYGRAWVNGRGEYLLSDQQGFDPNTTSTGNWTELRSVPPGR